MELGAPLKRGRPDGSVNGNGDFKKPKQEMESFTTGIGSKLKPCTKFFSSSGCPYGEGCHFLHYVPGGLKAVTQMLGSNPAMPTGIRNPVAPLPFADGPSPAVIKTRLCNNYNTPEGCRFGDKCRFAHGESDLGRPTMHDDTRSMGQIPGRYGGGPRMDQTPPHMGAAASFGASATAKVSIDASLAGAVIGKGGVNSKQICRMTGAKLSVRDHETDPNLRNIELDGSFDQIKQATQMVRELIVNLSAASSGMPMKRAGRVPAGNYKTKLCDNFTKGTCTFGERCHFAHGAEEMRMSGL